MTSIFTKTMTNTNQILNTSFFKARAATKEAAQFKTNQDSPGCHGIEDES